uniref:hypothetical protein n=1 Tax=Ensifer adhaerens TaxID=106592 RepID=UPI003F494009
MYVHVMREHLRNLKSLIGCLKPTGADGFEGLVGEVLSAITGAPFRLAASGRQDGIDGKAAFEQDAICFEGKLYSKAVPRSEVITKIADLARNEVEADLVWVLGATVQISTQLADDLQADARRNGLSVAILDWSSKGIPPLAVALAMAADQATAFLNAHASHSDQLKSGLEAIAHIQADGGLASIGRKIRTLLDAPSVGITMARQANAGWFARVLGDRDRARDWLGQPIAPADQASDTQLRSGLSQKVHAHVANGPDGSAICIRGDEGRGKSWAAIQSWTHLPEKPLLVFLVPDDFEESAPQNDIDGILIGKLIVQTGDVRSEALDTRWRRRFAAWRNGPVPDSLRLLVLIDGVNQRPNHEWGRIITKASRAVGELGGRVVFTVRDHYYRTRIEQALSVRCYEIDVPEWQPGERDEILRRHGIEPERLNAPVAERLRNPRLLSIALEVLDPQEVAAFEELSVSRLLFEHIRAGVRNEYASEPVDVFVDRLCSNAKEILRRLEDKKTEDLNIFEADTPAVAGGQFFHPVPGEPKKYELKDHGLTLALGFALIDRQRKARRNGGDMESALASMLEPIAALDDTADVLLAALTVLAADKDECTPDLVSALVRGFASLQNPEGGKFPVFVGLAKNLPLEFLVAARDIRLSEVYSPNIDWLETALIEARKQDAVWAIIATEIRGWLESYNLDPKRGMFLDERRDTPEEVRVEREKQQKEISENLAALSSDELTLLGSLTERDGDFAALAKMSFKLLAGKSLAPFASQLVRWSFAESLNSAIFSPEREFSNLISLNRNDWQPCRMALLAAAEPLRRTETSSAGKWALVRVLRATGDVIDAAEAKELADELTKDFPKYPSGSLRHKYCPADPCDPETQRPDELSITSERYRAIDVRKLSAGHYSTTEDHFFRQTSAAMARFDSEIAIAKHREFADSVFWRSDFSLRNTLADLRRHNALLDETYAKRLVAWSESIAHPGTGDRDSDKDTWLSVQYCLLLALPLLEPDEGVRALIGNKSGQQTLLQVLDALRCPSQTVFDDLLAREHAAGNFRNQHLLLEVARATGVALSETTREYIRHLPTSPDKQLRTSALGLIVERLDDDLLAAVVAVPDTSKQDREKHSYEAWYRSLAILEAAKRGFIDEGEALGRVSPRIYGRATAILGPDGLKEIARRVDISIRKAAQLDEQLVAPEIEISSEDGHSRLPARLNVSEKVPLTGALESVMARLSEKDAEFEERVQRTNAAYLKFRDGLTLAKARIVLDSLGLDEFAAIAAADWSTADKWCELFLRLPKAQLPFVHNLILLLAHAISERQPEKAEALFDRVRDGQPLVRFTFGTAAVDLGAMASWKGARTPVLDRIRRERLIGAPNDYRLSIEVLAALKCGHRELLENYITEMVSKTEPADVARAIMVAGFSDTTPFNDAVLGQYDGTHGMLGDAWKAAGYAYDRNRWARHWYAKMCAAEDAENLWCAAMLFLKVVDGRFSLWRSEYQDVRQPLMLFGPSIGSQLRGRNEKWEKDRKKKLFGREAPEPHFLVTNA